MEDPEHLLLRLELLLDDEGHEPEEIYAEGSSEGDEHSSSLEGSAAPAPAYSFTPLLLPPSSAVDEDEEDSDHLNTLLFPPSSPSVVPLFVDPLAEDELQLRATSPRLFRSLSQPLAAIDSEEEDGDEDDDRHRFLSQSGSASLALGKRTRSHTSTSAVKLARDRDALLARQTRISLHPLASLPRLWHDMSDLWSVSPPVPPPAANSVYDAVRHYDRTEAIGVYLIARGFPIIGEGRHTLVFLLTDKYVAKVARWDVGRGHDDLYFKHLEERNLDLAMARDYPACFARTELVYTFSPSTYRMYVQERLNMCGVIMHGLDADRIKRERNGYVIQCMLDNNKDIQFKQWAKACRRGERVKCFTAPGLEETLERDDLPMCFDYK